MPTPFANAYNFEKTYNHPRLKETIEKAEKAYQTFEPETIEFCKCAIECVAKEIFLIKNEVCEENQDFHILLGKTLNLLGLKKRTISRWNSGYR